jgi:flagellar protein FliO/FliZ
MSEKTMVILQGTIDELNSISPTPTQALAEEVAKSATRSGSTWDSLLQLIGLVFLLIIILIAAFYTSRFVGGMKLGQLKNSNFNVVDSYRLSQNKAIQIIKIGNKYVVVAIGKDTINYITELDEAEVIHREFNTKEKLSFKQLFDKYRNNNQ